jgi:hypothetical protein
MARYSLGVYGDDTEIQACLLNSGDASIEKLLRRRREVVHGRPVRNLDEDIKSIISEIGLTAEKNITALSGQYVMYRQMKRPFTDRKKIAETVGPEAETLLPVGDELNVDFVIVGKDEAGETLIETAAARKAEVDKIISYCKKAGIDPEVLEAPSSAIGAGARNVFNLGPERGYLVIYMGWRDTSLCILHGNVVKHMGSAPLGFERILEFVAKDKGISVNEAFDKAMATGIDGGSHLDRLIMEVMISLYKIPREVESYIAIPAGYATCINDLLEMLESSDIDKNLPSFKGIIYDGTAKDMMLSFMSVSLAFRGEDKVDMVNFYQHGSAFSLQMGKMRAQFGVWIKAVIVLIVMWGIGYTADTLLKSRISSKLNAQVKKQFTTVMPPGTTMIDPVVQLEQRLNKLNTIYGPGAGAGESPLTVLRELSDKIPSNLNTVIDSLTLDENALTLSGTTDSYENVEKVKTGISRIPFVKEVKIVSANVNKNDQKVVFRLTCSTGGSK